MTASLFYSGNDQEKLNEIRKRAEGMKYGSLEEGIPQLSEDALFLLSIVTRHERIHASLEEVLDRKANDNSVWGQLERRRNDLTNRLSQGKLHKDVLFALSVTVKEFDSILHGIEESKTEEEKREYLIERKEYEKQELEDSISMLKNELQTLRKGT